MTAIPLTLADYEAEPKPLVAGVAKILRENSKFMDILPFETTESLQVKVVMEGAMADVSWRDIGASHGSAKNGKPTEITENAFSVGNESVVDKAYVKDKSARLYNPQTYQTMLTTKSIARNFTNKAINGIPADVKNPVGLFWRCKTDLAASQNILAKTSGLDISPDATGLAANIQALIDKLDELLYAVTDTFESGNGVYIAMNDTLMGRLNSAFRQSGNLKTTADALGRVWTEYKGARFLDMGRAYDDSTRIIGNVELANGTALTGGTCTTAYAFKVGKEFFTGWQEYALDVSDYELQADKVTYKQVIDWMIGLAISHPRSVARLYGLIAA